MRIHQPHIILPAAFLHVSVIKNLDRALRVSGVNYLKHRISSFIASGLSAPGSIHRPVDSRRSEVGEAHAWLSDAQNGSWGLANSAQGTTLIDVHVFGSLMHLISSTTKYGVCLAFYKAAMLGFAVVTV